MDWREVLRERLPLLGHRNWVAVLDAAFPAFTSPGIELHLTGEDHPAVITHVRSSLAAAPHVQARPLVAEELRWVESHVARDLLSELAGCRFQAHADILTALDDVSRRYRMLLFKTTCTTPYTSVFFDLGCGYWTEAQEAEMRARMER